MFVVVSPPHLKLIYFIISWMCRPLVDHLFLVGIVGAIVLQRPTTK